MPVGGGWGEADPREAREPREEGGAGKGARRAGRPDRPGPARGEDARPRDPPSGSARASIDHYRATIVLNAVYI